MGRTLAEVFVGVRGETSKLGPDIQKGVARVDTSKAGDEAGRRYGRAFAGGAKALILGAGALLGSKALIDGAKESVNAASDLNETVSKTEQIFGRSAASVLAFGNKSATALGQSKNAALTAAANYGNLFNNLGFTQKKSAEMSTQLLRTATDLASFNNASPQEMLEGISSALAGEYDPLQRYGLAISAATVKQEALRLGLVKSTKDITPAIQAQASYSLILAQTGKAQGDFGRTAAGLANQQRIAAAQTENLKAKLGTALQPALLGIVGTLNKDFLPALTDLAEKKAPALGDRLGDIAERRGPQVVRFLTRAGQGISGLSALLVKGDFTRNFRQAFDVEEDSPVVDRLLRIRSGVLGIYDLVVKGDFTRNFREAFQLEEDSGTVDRILTIRDGVIGFFDAIRQGDTGELKTDLGSAAESIGKLGPLIGEFIAQMPAFSDVIHVGAEALGFLSEHTETLRKLMPLLVAGYVAYKGAQALANVAALLAVPTKIAEVVVNRQLIASNRALVASRVEVTGATVLGTVAEGASTSAKNVGILATLRGRAAALASSAAQLIVRGATIAWTGAQWLLNAALTANPVGLVIAAVALLAVGLVIAWKRSETFRDIVKGAFGVVADAGKFMWEKVLRPTFAFIVGAWLTVAGAIVNGAATAFGWVPGIGGKLKAAAKAFNRFRDDVNGALAGVKNRSVTVKATTLIAGGVDRATAIGTSLHRATGGPVFGAGTATSDSIQAMLSNGEHVLTAREVTGFGGHGAVERMRKAAAAGQVAGFATGGRVGFSINPQLAGLARFEAGLAAFNARVDGTARKLAAAAAAADGGGGGGVGGNAPGLAGAVTFASRQAGKPYVWGSAGPSGYDCTGFLSAVVNVAQGRSPYSRRFATGTLPAGLFVPGPGAFNIGWFTGNPGHAAATVNGVPMESRGGDGVVVGSRSRGANQAIFNRRAHLRGFADGGPVLPGDPPFDLLDRRGLHYKPGLKEALAGAGIGVATFDRGGVLPALSATLAVNGTNRAERIRTGPQDDALLAAVARMESARSDAGADPELLAEVRALRQAINRLAPDIGREVHRNSTKGGRA